MLLEASFDGASASMPIADPFRPDLDGIIARIQELAASNHTSVAALDLRGLIQQMIRGIAGCERGCPADAKGLISRGYEGFSLQYIEGGILTAQTTLDQNKKLVLKMFPDF
ncbi:MAG TPA: hypothetical protein VK445_02470 [Dissulfurispiraceae bacterium]|nr:hypothetical protein [Dissulfurispiraceae bacterium]